MQAPPLLLVRLAQSAEATDSNSVQYGFDSHGGHKKNPPTEMVRGFSYSLIASPMSNPPMMAVGIDGPQFRMVKTPTEAMVVL